MPKQPAFPSLRDAMKKKFTPRELFLIEMDAVVRWTRLLAVPDAKEADGMRTSLSKSTRPPQRRA